MSTPMNLLFSDAPTLEYIGVSRDPFSTNEALSDAYWCGLHFDPISSRAGVLFLLDWKSTDSTSIGSIGLLICSYVNDLRWKKDTTRRLVMPHWWTVLEANWILEVEPHQNTRDIMTHKSRISELFRYSILMNPNSELVISFKSASYFIGNTSIRDTEQPKVDFSSEAVWKCSSRWPAG
jgi:hypothetical protein